jgi:hypothetical protein
VALLECEKGIRPSGRVVRGSHEKWAAKQRQFWWEGGDEEVVRVAGARAECLNTPPHVTSCLVRAVTRF